MRQFLWPSRARLRALPEDRALRLWNKSLRRLEPRQRDDDCGASDVKTARLLDYLSRGLGARATLLTLNRGEGGRTPCRPTPYDALGIIRTNELLKADEYYGVIQLWGTEVDFGFSKTQEQSFERWDMNAYSTMLCWLSGVNGHR